MKPLSLTKAAVVVALAASAQAALAADGNVNFVGKIVDTPCSISPSSTNLTVPLGTVSRSVLNGAVGNRSTPAKFTIDLLNCGATVTGATVSFSGTPDATNANKLRIGVGEVAGTFATGAAIEIADSSGTPINLGSPSASYPLAQGNNSLQFQASYISVLSSVTTGTGNAVAQFTVAYQ
ncbi:fimbrial protein [Achromobacter sp. Marseille-Q0513]|uniref:fimbrial protein n=1 Tax=Achromobacter sp. Marseille-Q0513 TaxID=2829161 RepID=UPI001BA1D9F5|nr:fimbrial protein [Achromobacter sp. Marseille-Q0513]MBR8653514.1 fimbrial protein [Achromobacter sp. Marseille-Q0513]